MRLLKQAMGVLATLVVVLVIAALVMPKAAHGIAATLVQVVNTSANPVPVQETRSPALNSFTQNANCQFLTGSRCFNFQFFSIPPGRVAVVESISSQCAVDPGTSAMLFVDYTGAATQESSQIIVPYNSSEAFLGTPLTILGATVSTRAYAEPNTTIGVAWLVSKAQSAGNQSCFVTISGYFVTP
jgi:hypothetical protein